MKNKIGLLVALALIFAALLFSSPRAIKASNGASLSLSPGSQTVNVGSNFNVDIILNTAGIGVDGVDIFHLNFDPQLLEGVKIQNGTIFPIYLGSSTNNDKGMVSISGIINPGGSPYSGTGNFATVNFKAKSAGAAVLHFDFTSGATQDCNISEHATGKDILASVSDAKISIVGEGEKIPESQNGAAAVNPSGSGSSGTSPTPNKSGNSSSPSLGVNENGQSQPFMQKEAEIAGYKVSMGVIIWIVAGVILVLLAIGILIQLRKMKKKRSQNINNLK